MHASYIELFNANLSLYDQLIQYSFFPIQHYCVMQYLSSGFFNPGFVADYYSVLLIPTRNLIQVTMV